MPRKVVTLRSEARALTPGQELAREIRRTGITQPEAGRLVGVDDRQVRRWIRDEAGRPDRLALFFALKAQSRLAPQSASERACTETDATERHCVQAWDDSARGEAAEGVARRAA
jgi:hypothetical protein